MSRTKHELILASKDEPLAQYLLEIDSRPWYIPRETREFLKVFYVSTCAICGKKNGPMHIDHIIPVDDGGTCKFDNLQLLCRTCNLQKSNHYLDPRSYTLGYVVTVPINREELRKFKERILDILSDERY